MGLMAEKRRKGRTRVAHDNCKSKISLLHSNMASISILVPSWLARGRTGEGQGVKGGGHRLVWSWQVITELLSICRYFDKEGALGKTRNKPALAPGLLSSRRDSILRKLGKIQLWALFHTCGHPPHTHIHLVKRGFEKFKCVNSTALRDFSSPSS